MKPPPKPPWLAAKNPQVGDWLNLEPPEPAQLIYMDPPYMSQRDYGDFDDRWSWDKRATDNLDALNETHRRLAIWIKSWVLEEHSPAMAAYLAFMAPRLVKIHRMLKPTGSVFLHCDQYADSYLRLLLDAVFGNKNFRNQIRWCYTGWNIGKKKLSAKHDTLHWYAKDEAQVKVNIPYGPLSESRLKQFNQVDEDGRKFVWGSKKVDGKTAVDKTKRIHLDETKGAKLPDWWSDIGWVKRNSKEHVEYPTQKPLALLERVISCATDPGDLVIDPMCGSGTTLVAAKQLGRRYWGCDINPRAITLANQRLSFPPCRE